MLEREIYFDIAKKYGHHASWAVWANEGSKPKSNVGDISIFDLSNNPDLLNILNPKVVMVGLNFSRPVEKIKFVNFHDKRPQGQDYKIRYAFRDTEYYGAYMTDIIKDFEEKISGSVLSYLKLNEKFELQNIKLFEQEMNDLKSDNPLIIAFGKITFDLLSKHFEGIYRIKKVLHYGYQISKENYRKIVLQTLQNKE